MDRLTNGINGSFQGKVGNAIGSSWEGIPYIKGPYKKLTSKVGEAEKGTAINSTWPGDGSKPELPFVREGFKNYTPGE